MTRHMVTYGSRQIYFDLVRKNVKNINLNIRPDMTIRVSANNRVPLDFIKDFIREKAPWIVKHLDHFKDFQPDSRLERQYVSGEAVRYLGRQYRLRVREAEPELVKYFRGFVYIYVKDKGDLAKKERLFNQWLHEKSHIHFNQALDRMHELVRPYNIARPGLNIRRMTSRWGSCHRQKGTITLNLALIMAPKDCIDYVALHELIHFKYKNHDRDFYNFLTCLMPDWEERKKILDERVIMYLQGY